VIVLPCYMHKTRTVVPSELDKWKWVISKIIEKLQLLCQNNMNHRSALSLVILNNFKDINN
jgi:hypothetical protein